MCDALVERESQNTGAKQMDDETGDIGDDLQIRKITRQAAGAGKWAIGSVAGHHFEALVFPAHADDPEFELGQSQISKLWIKRIEADREVFNWDRGADVPAADDTTHAVVDPGRRIGSHSLRGPRLKHLPDSSRN